MKVRGRGPPKGKAPEGKGKAGMSPAVASLPGKRPGTAGEGLCRPASFAGPRFGTVLRPGNGAEEKTLKAKARQRDPFHHGGEWIPPYIPQPDRCGIPSVPSFPRPKACLKIPGKIRYLLYFQISPRRNVFLFSLPKTRKPCLHRAKSCVFLLLFPLVDGKIYST